jgi:protein-disulfide isomerase
MYRKLIVLVLLAAPLAMGQGPGENQVIAEVNGHGITTAEVTKSAGVSVARLEEQAYRLKRQKLDELITERLLSDEAARRGITVKALMDAEVSGAAQKVSNEDVHAFYEANKSQLTGDESVLLDQIKAYLRNTRTTQRRDAFLGTLSKRANISVYLPPPSSRVTVDVDGAPTRGPANAPVTIVVFEDLLCPFCKRANAVLTEVLTRYPGQVRLIHRDFPLDNLHPASRNLHAAARCAAEQNKFWEYRDKIYANATPTAAGELNSYAKALSLDMPAFQHCIDKGLHAKDVQADVDAGSRLGIDSTPAFFVNGRPVAGAQPLATFVSMIEEEIQLTNAVRNTASKNPIATQANEK